MDKDLRWLPTLAPQLPVSIPVPLAKGGPADGYPWDWGVYTWLDGHNPTIDRIGDHASFATDAARFIEALQLIDPTGGPSTHRGGPLAVQDDQARAAISALRGTIDTNAATAAWDGALETPAWSGAPVWIHGDLLPGNLLCTDGRLRGVIDWGVAGVGDPACDLIVAWSLLTAEARAFFRSALSVDDATWARGRGWALSVGLIALPYYRDTNPVFAAIARRLVDEVLADERLARKSIARPDYRE
jgi:aminoglycoside phosphotransferase (APT) family kinase protein